MDVTFHVLLRHARSACRGQQSSGLWSKPLPHHHVSNPCQVVTQSTSQAYAAFRTPDRSSTETTFVRRETDVVARIEQRVAALAGVPETLCSPISVLRYGQVVRRHTCGAKCHAVHLWAFTALAVNTGRSIQAASRPLPGLAAHVDSDPVPVRVPATLMLDVCR